MLTKVKVVVLYTLKYNDSSLIVHTFSEDRGRISFWLRIPKSRKSVVKSVIFQPFSLLDLEVEISPRGGLHYIKESKFSYPFCSLPFNPIKVSLTLFLTEVLSHVLMEGVENPALFAYLQYSALWLDKCEGSVSNFHLVFLIRLTRFLGFYPNLENYHLGDFFDLRNGCFVGKQPLYPQYLRPAEASLMRTLLRMNYDTMHLFRLTREERNRFVQIILSYYVVHIPNFPELKSLTVLKELFD